MPVVAAAYAEASAHGLTRLASSQVSCFDFIEGRTDAGEIDLGKAGLGFGRRQLGHLEPDFSQDRTSRLRVGVVAGEHPQRAGAVVQTSLPACFMLPPEREGPGGELNV